MRKTWLSIMCVCLLLCLIFMFSYDNNTVPEAITTAENIVYEIPAIEEFFSEKKNLFEEAQDVFTSHEFSRISGRGANLKVALTDGTWENFADTNLFNAKEKDCVATLFSDEGPLVEYCAGQFFAESETTKKSNVVDIRIAYIKESEVANVAQYTYYMKEISDNWYVCIVINLSITNVDLDEYKMKRPDKGMICLTT